MRIFILLISSSFIHENGLIIYEIEKNPRIVEFRTGNNILKFSVKNNKITIFLLLLDFYRRKFYANLNFLKKHVQLATIIE